MKLTQYNAISIDGFIATSQGNSDWVSEIDNRYFEEAILKSKCIIVGRRTFQQYADLYPVPGILNIVMSSNVNQIKQYDNVIYSDKTPSEVLKMIEDKGIENPILIGGGVTNGSFLKENLIDELILDIHPLVLGSGIKLYENVEINLNLEIISAADIGEGQLLNTYSFIK